MWLHAVPFLPTVGTRIAGEDVAIIRRRVPRRIKGGSGGPFIDVRIVPEPCLVVLVHNL
jgi:hypothetical protein